MLGLPPGVVASLSGLVLEQRGLAYARIDAGHRVADAGGHLARYGLGDLRRGASAVEWLPVLEGLLPLPESPFILRSIELGGERAADLQLFAEGEDVWLLILDVTAERDAARRVQQKAYEMTLLQEKEARLNRRLQEANAALRDAQTALQQAYAQLESELAEAAAYVRSILPAPMREPFDADWRFVPSARLGGDGFGYHRVDDDHWAIYLLDVCGHGVGPSLLSVGALDAIRSGRLPDADPRDPGGVLAAVNDAFQMDRHNGLYFTLWYGVYQPSGRRLAYTSGGHPPALLLRGGGASPVEVDALRGVGPPLGVLPAGRWPAREAELRAGDRLYVLSDGCYEVGRPDGTTMMLQDLVDYLRRAPRDDAGELDALLAHLRGERGDDTLEDDVSVIRFAFR